MTPQERQEDKRKWRDSWGRWEKKVEKQDTNSIFISLRSWHLFHHFKVYPWRQLNQWQILFSWPPMSLQAVNEDKKLIDTCPWMKIYDKSRHCIKKQRYYGQICSSQSYGFPSSHVLGLQQEGYTKIECQCIAALQLWAWRRLLGVPWTARRSIQSILKEINLTNHGRTDADREEPALWTPEAKSWNTWKDHDSGKDWGQVEKGTTEDKMSADHHWPNGQEFEQILGDLKEWMAWCATVYGPQGVRKKLSN